MQNKRGLVIGLYAAVGVPLLVVLYAAYWLWQDFYGIADNFQRIEESAARQGVTFEYESFLGDAAGESAEDGWHLMEEASVDWASVDAEKQAATIRALRGVATPIGGQTAEGSAAMSLAAGYAARYKAALSKPAFVVERDWSTARGAGEKSARAVTELSRLIVTYAEALAGSGRVGEAMATLDAVRKCGARYSADGGLDALSLHVLLETMALTGACDSALYAGPVVGPKALAAFVADRSTAPDTVRCLEGEAIRTVSVLSSADSYNDDDFCGTKLSIRSATYQKAGAARMMEFWVSVLPDARGQSADPSSVRDTYYKACQEFVGRRSASGVIAASIAQWHKPRLDLAAALETKYALVTVLAEIMANHDPWPDALPTVASDCIDEYSGNAYKYFRAEDGIVLYSVGKDCRDNDGSGRPSGAGTDIAVRVYPDRVTIEGR